MARRSADRNRDSGRNRSSTPLPTTRITSRETPHRRTTSSAVASRHAEHAGRTQRGLAVEGLHRLDLGGRLGLREEQRREVVDRDDARHPTRSREHALRRPEHVGSAHGAPRRDRERPPRRRPFIRSPTGRALPTCEGAKAKVFASSDTRSPPSASSETIRERYFGMPPQRASSTLASTATCRVLNWPERIRSSSRVSENPANSSSSSARITCMTALMSARWVNACGKFPRWRPDCGSISSA